jgi:hypothetical protein
MELNEYLSNALNDDDYRITEATIIGPYISADFCAAFLGQGERSVRVRDRLTVLADDGWDPEQLAKIQEIHSNSPGAARRKLTIARVRPKSVYTGQRAHGLVHVKLLHLKLEKRKGSYSKQVILTGSANASMQGFGVHAESYMHIDMAFLRDRDKVPLQNWLRQISEQDTEVSSIKFSIGRGSWICLPALRRTPLVEPPAFDAWLRRGVLCYRFAGDPAFGRFRLQLKSPLPQGHVATLVVNSGFGQESDSRSFSWRYAGKDINTSTDEDARKRVTWREKYFIETRYGFWTSDRIFSKHKVEFEYPAAHARRSCIEEVRRGKSDPSQHATWISEWIASLLRLFDTLKQEGLNPALWLECQSDGSLTTKHYHALAQKQLQRDISQLESPAFEERYSSGFEFHRVPRLDGQDFEIFTQDWADTLSVRLNQGVIKNCFARTLADSPEYCQIPPHELLSNFRNTANDDSFFEALKTAGLDKDADQIADSYPN